MWAWVGWVGWCGRALACHAWPRVAPTQPYSDKVQSLEQQRVAQEQKLSEVIGCTTAMSRPTAMSRHRPANNLFKHVFNLFIHIV